MYSESLSAVTEPTGHRSGFFPLGVVFIYYFFICIVDRGEKIYIYTCINGSGDENAYLKVTSLWVYNLATRGIEILII